MDWDELTEEWPSDKENQQPQFHSLKKAPIDKKASFGSSRFSEDVLDEEDPFLSQHQSSIGSVEIHHDQPQEHPLMCTKENFSFEAPPAPPSPPLKFMSSSEVSESLKGRLTELISQLDSVEYISNDDGSKRIRLSSEEPRENLPRLVLSTSKKQPVNNILPDEYPEHIDFLEDLAEKTPVKPTVPPSPAKSQPVTRTVSDSSSNSTKSAGSKKNKMVLIRNLNASSALLQALADTHNMSFNDEKKCWEGNDENLDELMPDEAAKELSDDFQSAIDELDEPSIIQMDMRIDLEKEQSFMENSIGINPADSSVIIKEDISEMEKEEPLLDERYPTSLPQSEPIKNNLDVSLDTSVHFKGVERALQSLADIDLTRAQSFMSEPSLLLPSKEAIKSKEEKPSQVDFSRVSRNSRASTIQQILSSTSNKEDVSLNISLDSLLSHLVKALKLTDEFQQVEVLDLSGHELTSVMGLSKYTSNLIELNLKQNRLLYLTGLPSTLRKLNLSANRLSNLTSFSKLTNLTHLNVSNNSINDLSCLKLLVHLQELDASYNCLSDLNDVKSFESLIMLTARGNKIEHLDFHDSRVISLLSLDVSENQIEVLENIESLTALKEIVIDSNMIRTMKLQTDMPNLETLSLNRNEIQEFDGQYWPGLKILFIDHNPLQSLKNEQDMVSLEVLSIEYQKNECKVAVDLSKFFKLRELRVSGNPFHSYAHLLSQKQTQALVVKNCQLSMTKVLHPIFDTIRALDLSGNKLTDLLSLSSAYQLKGLWLTDCGLSDFKAIMTLVRKLKFLEILDLRNNPVTEKLYPKNTVQVPQPSPVVNGSLLSVATQSVMSNPKSVMVKWLEADQQYLKETSDKTLVRRMCYRNLIIYRRKNSLRMLDGIPVTKENREDSIHGMEHMKERVRQLRNSLGQLDFDRMVTTSPKKEEDEGVDILFGSDMDELQDWTPVSHPVTIGIAFGQQAEEMARYFRIHPDDFYSLHPDDQLEMVMEYRKRHFERLIQRRKQFMDPWDRKSKNWMEPPVMFNRPINKDKEMKKIDEAIKPIGVVFDSSDLDKTFYKVIEEAVDRKNPNYWTTYISTNREAIHAHYLTIRPSLLTLVSQKLMYLADEQKSWLLTLFLDCIPNGYHEDRQQVFQIFTQRILEMQTYETADVCSRYSTRLLSQNMPLMMKHNIQLDGRTFDILKECWIKTTDYDLLIPIIKNMTPDYLRDLFKTHSIDEGTKKGLFSQFIMAFEVSDHSNVYFEPVHQLIGDYFEMFFFFLSSEFFNDKQNLALDTGYKLAHKVLNSSNSGAKAELISILQKPSHNPKLMNDIIARIQKNDPLYLKDHLVSKPFMAKADFEEIIMDKIVKEALCKDKLQIWKTFYVQNQKKIHELYPEYKEYFGKKAKEYIDYYISTYPWIAEVFSDIIPPSNIEDRTKLNKYIETAKEKAKNEWYIGKTWAYYGSCW